MSFTCNTFASHAIHGTNNIDIFSVPMGWEIVRRATAAMTIPVHGSAAANISAVPAPAGWDYHLHDMIPRF